MEFHHLVQRALDIRKRYEQFERQRYGREWTREELALGLVGDIGDLVKLVQACEGIRAIPEAQEKLAHELSDCLWSLMVLAQKYQIDLESNFLTTMDELEGFLHQGDPGASGKEKQPSSACTLPTRILSGERIGAGVPLRVGCSATIFDPTREKIFLTRRADNNSWCLPGGGMDAGESIAETCAREVWEETGLQVCVTRLIGVYSSPHHMIAYPDGNCFQIVALNFEAEITGGEAGLRDETTAMDFFTAQEIERLDLMEHHRERIQDAFTFFGEPYLR
jgi:ADP-ribose pyrophosphatase YjhB (NUDIX family)/NTP pyrophosphatase (non-canonical NTP hydrolase)